MRKQLAFWLASVIFLVTLLVEQPAGQVTFAEAENTNLVGELQENLQNLRQQLQQAENALQTQRAAFAELTKQLEHWKKIKRGDWIPVTATAYTADCEGCSGFTYHSGIDVRYSTPKIIAVDPTVIPFGLVELMVNGESWGVYLADDTGSAIKGNRIDILMGSREEALKFGVQKNVKVRVLQIYPDS